jgi:hypothetical protein
VAVHRRALAGLLSFEASEGFLCEVPTVLPSELAGQGDAIAPRSVETTFAELALCPGKLREKKLKFCSVNSIYGIGKSRIW